MKKILFISPANSVHSSKWINFFLLNTNYKITWISFYKKNQNLFIDKNIDYHELTFKTLFKNYLLLKKILKNNYHLVHLHYIGKFSYLLLMFNFKKLVISPWGSDLKLVKKRSFKFYLVKKIINKANIITVDADFMIKEILRFNKKKKNIHRINFGTDTDIFSYHNRYLQFSKLKIISLRNLESIYSISTLIEAAKILKDDDIDFEIDIYGMGSLKDNLQSLIKAFNLNESVFLKGKFEYGKLPSILEKYNLYISTSTTDAGIAASTSESMSTGLIPISADNSENKFWITKDEGLLFKTSSPQDLAEKIIEFYNLPLDVKVKMSKNSRKRIIEFNSYRNEMNKMLKIYNAE